jgi:hypothetical protein
MTLIPAYPAGNLSNSSIAFPLRLRHGLLQKTDEREAFLMLIEIMARTPRGSWAGHPAFGFQEFFLETSREGLTPEARSRIAQAAVDEINAVLRDLDIMQYRVDSFVFEPIPKEVQGVDRARWMGRSSEGRGVTLMLRENGSSHAAGYAL